jgi:uncharacterized protein YggE
MRSHLLLLAPALLLAGPAVAQVAPPLPDGTILDISAEGHTARVPDVATIRAGVVTQGSSAAGALADNAARMARVLAALKQAGVPPRDIRTANVSLSPQYRYTDGQAPVVTGYQASNSVAIRFRDVAKSGAILDVLVGQGANQIDGPSLSIDSPDAALDEARVAAMKTARARAELYAKAAGLSVVRIVSLSENGANDGGSPQPIVFARAMKASAPTQIAAGETEVSVTLSVKFLLK